MKQRETFDETWPADPPPPNARVVWDAMLRRSSAGEMYLAARGLEVEKLIMRGVLRFNPKSSAPCLPLWGLALADHPVNVVTRNLPRAMTRGGPKVYGMSRAPTLGSLCGQAAQIDRGRDVVVCEGVVDTLTAHMAWPEAIVLGAHGALRIPDIAKEAAHRVRVARGRMLLCVHSDENDTGAAKATEAGLIAQRAGMRLDRDLVVVDHDGFKDLNDAWCGGWRP